MFQRIRALVADVCRYEETAPIDSACMRCILLWSAVVLVLLNLSCNSFERPIVFVSTLFVCLTLFGVSFLLSRVRHPKHTVLAGAVLIVLMGLACLVSNENNGFQTLWLLFLPAMLLIQLGLKQAVPICSAYGLCAMVLLWGSPERLVNAYPRDYRIYYPVFYWEFLLAMVVADLFYKSYRIRREQTEQEMEAEVHATMGKAQKLILSSVAAINQMIDEKDHYTSEHSRRVAQYSRIIAKHLDPTLSEEELERLYRSALLHDIGKAVDHEMEGTHIQLGVEFCRKYKEKEDIIHAIQAHHGDVECKTLVACLVQAADAVSAARPGARRENLENYIKRLEKLEEITSDYPGVEKSYAIQAGREVRVMVKPEQVSEDQMVILARELARRIESELEYPGQIKVHVLRETKVVEYAK